MGKEIVILLGSPRKNGNSEQLADALIKGAERAGHRVTRIYANDLDAGCCDCGGCYHTEETPCCQHPDFNGIARAILRADGIVFATPLYWYDISGKLKSLIDNMYCFYATGKPLARKRAAMICCGHAEDYMMFDGVQRTFELIVRAMDWSTAGQIYVPGVFRPGDVQHTDGLKRCETLGEHFFG